MIVRFKLGFFYSKSWPPCQKQANFKGPLLKVLTYTSCTYSRKPQNLLHCNQETNLNCALIMWQQLSVGMVIVFFSIGQFGVIRSKCTFQSPRKMFGPSLQIASYEELSSSETRSVQMTGKRATQRFHTV